MRRLLDPRFADVTRRLVETRRELAQEAQTTRATVEQTVGVVGDYTVASIESMTFLGNELRDMHAAIGDIASAYEVRTYVDRLDRLVGGSQKALDGAAAALINYANSHRGFAAQAELWLNPAITIEHGEGSVTLGTVNERIVEVPFALRALGRVPPGCRILDFGSSENSLALSLATLGYEVTALDLRPYPFEHPSLRSVTSRLEDWDAPAGSFDAILSVSTLEHVGLGWYGEPQGQSDADRRALSRLGELLAPEGILVLTVPYGAASVDSVQRRYDRDSLAALLEGWEVLDRAIVERKDDRTWRPVEESTGHAVAMVVARISQTS